LQKKGFRVNFGLVAKAKSLAGDEQIEWKYLLRGVTLIKFNLFAL
jgi:hypothetical protein